MMIERNSSLTNKLASFATATSFNDLPPEVVRECKRLLLDTVGCALGALTTRSGEVALQFANVLGGEATTSAVGLDRKTSPISAAYVNARLANVLDADDTFPTATHFGSTAIFGALAAAEHFNRGGRELITAIAVGFDVGARIGSWMGMPIQIKDGRVAGWNQVAGPAATETWAAVGSAVSGAGINLSEAIHAFGIAGANSPLPAQHKFGEQTVVPMHKYADAGWCANVGVSATLLASVGSTGFADILDGENGFWKLYGQPGHDDERLLRGLGSDWQILNTTYKPWPCCRFIHYPLTAFKRLREAHGIQANEIEGITVRSCPFSFVPMFHDKNPPDLLTAEFSFPHAFAAMALDVPPGSAWYADEVITAPGFRDLKEKVKVEAEPTAANMADWIEGGQWRGIPGGVDVQARGRTFSETVHYAMGDPWSEETLLTDEALMAKFQAMVGIDPNTSTNEPILRDAANRFTNCIANLEFIETAELSDAMRELGTAILASARP